MKKITIILLLSLSLFCCGKKGSLELPEDVSLNNVIQAVSKIA
jgi:predicted small lipoprotein YifL